MCEVVVSTGSRLHFGLYALNREFDRQFAGIGMMVDAPGVRVRIASAPQEQVIAPDAVRDRVRTFVGRFRESCSDAATSQVEVTDFIPAHHGLGSGTQLALAIGKALSVMSGTDHTAVELATATGRGVRSAIGIHGFEQGGFIVDAGHPPDGSVGQLSQRFEIPAEWRVILVMPEDCEGLSGQSEVEAFGNLPQMSDSLTQSLHSYVTDGVIPGLRTRNFDAFASALHEFGQSIGEYFSPVQGGVFRSASAADLAAALRRDGVPAVVQSSWGPTVCVFAKDEEHARFITQRMPNGLRHSVVTPRNTGATVTTIGSV